MAIYYNPFFFLFVFFALCLGWWLYVDLYQELRVDITRQRLFKLRDDLFDLAVDEIIPFDHPAYGMCRKTINGMIRYCHKLSLYRIIIDYFVLGNDRQILRDNYCRVKELAHRSLSKEQKDSIDEIYVNMHGIIVVHLIKTWLPLLIIATVLRMVFKAFNILGSVRNVLFEVTRRPMVDIDAKAKHYGASSFNPDNMAA